MKSICLVAVSLLLSSSQAIRLSSESSQQEKLYKFIKEDEEKPSDDSFVQYHKRKIYDADGDGVEDNIKKSYSELDDFYWPCQFGAVDEINNTHHGNLPGHVNLEWDLVHEVEPQPSKFTLEKQVAYNK